MLSEGFARMTEPCIYQASLEERLERGGLVDFAIAPFPILSA